MRVHTPRQIRIEVRRPRNLATRKASRAKIVVFEQLKTPFGHLFWNPARAGWAVLAALLGAVIGLVCGSFFSSLLVGPLLSSLIGLASSFLGAVALAACTLKESALLPWLPRTNRGETCFF